jgi:two-component system response regulator HydG
MVMDDMGVRERGRMRRRDRRAAIAGLLAALPPLLRRSDSGMLRRVFEDGVRSLVSAERVQLREASLPPIRLVGGVAPTVAIEVPTGDLQRGLFLEAAAPAGQRFDEWDMQVLAMCSQLAAVVVEIERLRAPRPVVAGAAAQPPFPEVSALVGSTPAMRALRQRIDRIAATDFTVLIEGESGTGKELVARQLHERSRRRLGPFVAVNCAALVETLLEAELFGIEERTATGVRGRRGKFEHAHGGTLFLDEVSDLSASAQAKLLRAIQDLAVERVGGQGAHAVDIRIVAATNRSLRRMVDAGTFRADLFYRLSGIELHVPPLRARQPDIVQLARHFLDRYRDMRLVELSTPACDALVAYHWPGNVRELQRVIEGVVALAQGHRVELDDLPATVRGDVEEILLPSIARSDTMRAWGSRYARLVLHKCGENKRRACDVLGISYHTLQAYLRYRDRPRAARGGGSGWSSPAPASAAPGVVAES